MKIIVLTNPKAIEKFNSKWIKFWRKDSNKSLFNSPFWFQSCLKVFKHSKTLVIVALNSKGEILAIIPLVLDKKFGTNLYVSPGGKYLDQSTLLISKDIKGTEINQIMQFMSKNYDYCLNEIPSRDFQSLKLANKEFSYSIASTGRDLVFENNPYRNLNKENLRRLKKRLNDNKNTLSFKYNQYSLGKSLQLSKTIEKNSNKVEKFKSIFSDLKLIRLCSELNKNKEINVNFSFLFYQNIPICYKFGFILDQKYHYSNSAYNKNYSKLSPGRLLMIKLIEELQSNKINYIDFSRGETNFKKEFSKNMYEQYVIYSLRNPVKQLTWQLIYSIKPFVVKNESAIDNMFSVFKKPLIWMFKK